MNTIATHFATQGTVDKALDRVVAALKKIDALVSWIGADHIIRSVGFGAAAELTPPFIIVSATQEEEEFHPSGRVDLTLPVAIAIGYEVTGVAEVEGEATILTVVSEIKEYLYSKPIFALIVNPGDNALTVGIKNFDLIDYQTQQLQSGSIEALALLKVVYRMHLKTSTREPWSQP